MRALIVHVSVHGLNWLLVSWVAIATLGVTFEYDNIRGAVGMARSVRVGEPGERSMRASSAGLLAVHMAITAILGVTGLAGVGLLIGALTSGLDLQFSSATGQVFVIGLALSLPTGSTLIAGMLWQWRRGTLRSLRRHVRLSGQVGTAVTLPAMTIVISVQNLSTVVPDAEVASALPDFQTQLNRDFAPAWGRNAYLGGLVAKGQQPAPGTWLIALFDDADQAGALGYHDYTPGGQPLAKVFVKTTKDAGEAWTVVFSHELLEMLADPYINSTTFIDDGSGSGWLIPVEACDPVQGEQYAYLIGKTLCSDFVLPSWFAQGSTGPWDHGSHLPQSLYVLPDCYCSIAPVNLPEGWQQVFGDLSKGGEKRPGGPVADPDDK